MPYHILNGDCLAVQLKHTTLEGESIICREALMEGPVQSANLEIFWADRAAYIQESYHDTADHYFNSVVTEFAKIQSIPQGAEVCLWFEHDLFCQVNMWFVMTLLPAVSDIKVYRVAPVITDSNDTWKGFGISDAAMLERAYAEKIRLTDADVKLGMSLWKAFSTNDFDQLKSLSSTDSQTFRFLPEVCKAHIERFPEGTGLNRPERVITELINNTSGEFNDVFSAFSAREGIYGFGDLQVKSIYDRLMNQA
jgi:hypothetical protein